MFAKFFLVITIVISSVGVFAQGSFDYSDSIFEVGQVRVDNDVTFINGKLRVDPITQPFLDRLVSFLKTNDKVTFEIEVHTDVRGSSSANLKMGVLRSRSLFFYLISEGVKEFQLVPKSYGESDPIHSSEEINKFRDSDKDMFKRLHLENHRVQLKVLSVE